MCVRNTEILLFPPHGSVSSDKKEKTATKIERTIRDCGASLHRVGWLGIISRQLSRQVVVVCAWGERFFGEREARVKMLGEREGDKHVKMGCMCTICTILGPHIYFDE